MAKAWKMKGIHPQSSYRWNAHVILAVKVEEVYSWAKPIRNRDKVKETPQPANLSEAATVLDGVLRHQLR